MPEPRDLLDNEHREEWRCPYCHRNPCVGHGNEVTLMPAGTTTEATERMECADCGAPWVGSNNTVVPSSGLTCERCGGHNISGTFRLRTTPE